MATGIFGFDDRLKSFLKNRLEAFQRRMRIRREEKELERALRLDWLNQWPVTTNRVGIDQLDVEKNYPTLMEEYRRSKTKNSGVAASAGDNG